MSFPTATSSSAGHTCAPSWPKYQQHYNTARPHQGINQLVPSGEDHHPRVTASDFRTRQILRKPILSGLINEYARVA